MLEQFQDEGFYEIQVASSIIELPIRCDRLDFISSSIR